MNWTKEVQIFSRQEILLKDISKVEINGTTYIMLIDEKTQNCKDGDSRNLSINWIQFKKL